MINTDKYKGHTEGPWVVDDNEIYSYSNGDKGGLVVLGYHSTMTTTNLKLIADAPLLLSEYKRLQKRNESLEKVLQLAQQYGSIDLPKLIANKFHNFWVFNSPVGEEE